MEKLEYTKVNLVDESDWNSFIRKVYNKYYDFQQQEHGRDKGQFTFNIPFEKELDLEEEQKNHHTSIPFKVNGDKRGIKFDVWVNTKVEDVNKHFKDKFSSEMFWERNYYPGIYSIIKDLSDNGRLEEGKYVINIDW